MGIKRRMSAVSETGEGICMVDPTTAGGRKIQNLQLVGLPLLPGVVLLIYLLFAMASTVQDLMANMRIRHLVTLSDTMTGEVLKDLRDEAGGLVTFVGVNGTELLGTTLKLYTKTDVSLSQTAWPEGGLPGFPTRRSFTQSLARHRQAMKIGADQVEFQIKYYRSLFAAINDWLLVTYADIGVSEVRPQLLSYANLVFSSNEFIFQKVLGIMHYILGNLEVEHYVIYEKVQNRGIAFLETAADLHNPVSESYQRLILSNSDMKEMFDVFWKELDGTVKLKADLYKVMSWNGRMNFLLEMIETMRSEVVQETLDFLDTASDAHIRVLPYYVIICLLLLCVLSPFIIMDAQRTTNNLRVYATMMYKNNLELRREKRKSERLLTEMLPRSVAERLRRGDEVAAETYSQATVFFSDIPDFAEISKNSSPIEIVMFLNEVYRFIDDHLECFDVYKVETIGCVYMVVSGLPSRNGERHAFEIGQMSVDLLENIEDFIIPHMRERRLRLRIGVCSGPCVAGVVGLKSPRYCLFGDTVNTASRMQSHGEADKIHITTTTYELLSKRQDFRMERRGVISIKGKGKMLTYWLVSRESTRARRGSRESILSEQPAPSLPGSVGSDI